MSPLAVGGLGIAALFALIFIQVPIGFSMMIVGVAGLALQTSWGPALTLLASETSSVLASVDLAAVPLFSGIFTVNEAASVAAVLSFLCTILRKRLTMTNLIEDFRESASATAMLYTILIGAFVFTYFITYARIPEALVLTIKALSSPPLGIIFIILLAYLLLGAVFDNISAMLITLPFVIADPGLLAILVLYPQISLWLPKLMAN